MDTCAKCGKQLGWLDRHSGNSRWLEKHPEWKDKKICIRCMTEINTKERGREEPLIVKAVE
jgi:DNA-directed RNA polymerase subunit RPC12/RpoP